MIQVIKCPSCAAPLEFEGSLIEKCEFCGSRVIVSPSDVKNETSFGFDSLLGKAQKLKEILRLARAGRKIEAVRLYRETFGVGLAEAKNSVERLERGESIDFQNVNFQSYEPLKIDGEAIAKTAKVIGGITLAAIALGIIAALAGIGVAIYTAVKGSEDDPVSVSTPAPSPTPTTSPGQIEKPPYATEVLRFGGDGTGAGYFKDNRSIAVDNEERIYSGDYTGGRIQVFDKDGKFISQWTIDEKMPLLDIAADRKGNIFVSQKGSIYKFAGATGKLLGETFVAGGHLRDLSVSLDGRIIASNDRSIYVFDENLKQLAVWKDAAQQAGISFGISRLAVNGLGEAYALGREGKNVYRFSRDGKFLDRFKTKSGSGVDIAVDGKNRIVISDVSNIYVYDADGEFIDSFKTTQAFGMVFNDAGELLTASRPFVVKYNLKD